MLSLLDSSRGAILADDVGLGKTHVAGAVIRSRPNWRPVLIAAPASVLDSWKGLLADVDDVFFTSFAHLSRGTGPADRFLGRISTITGDSDTGFVVVDEAHRLRNPLTKRYAAVAKLARTNRVLLVTATPIHNSIADAASLLSLVSPVALPLHRSDWHERDLERLRLALGRVLVRRTRWTIENIYSPHHRVVGGLDLRFPARAATTARVELGQKHAALVDELPALVRAILPEPAGTDAHGLVRSLLLKRLESSPAALRGTLRRCRNYLVRAREAAAHGRVLPRSGFRDLFGVDVDGQVVQIVMPFFYDHLEAGSETDWSSAIVTLSATLQQLDEIRPRDDQKLSRLVELLADGPSERTLIMTTYLDTARYLYEQLEGLCVLLTGEGAWVRRIGRIPRALALRAFAPVSQGAAPPAGIPDLSVMVATDVLCEGVNLQDASCLVHYDRPWNPMAIEQRAGRIDRLNSTHDRVKIVTFEVSRPVERALRFEDRLARKLDQRNAVLMGEENVSCAADIGLDTDGFLLACSARVGLCDGQLPVVARQSSEGPNWLLALECDGRVHFVIIGPTTKQSVVEALVSLLDSREQHPRGANDSSAPSPPDRLVRDAVEKREEELLAVRLLELDPSESPTSRSHLRRTAVQLGRTALRAYWRGDLDDLQTCDGASERLASLSVASLERLGEIDLSTLSGVVPASSVNANRRLPRVRVLGWLALT